ncbi:MAG: HAD family phosphatase [Clostridia bacterium]|nr:HAD family phosphatase [Clostridia bacterium]
MIHNIVFDLGGVLIEKADKEFVEKWLSNKEDTDLVYQTVFYSKIREQMDKGLMSKEESFAKIFSDIPERSREEAKKMYEYYFNHRKPTKNMPEFIKSLKDCGFSLYILSNFFESFSKLSSQDGLEFLNLFDGVFISSDNLTIKPEKEIYQKFLSKYELEASDCFFVDDRENNVLGAQDIGMSGYVFDDVSGLIKYMFSQKIL